MPSQARRIALAIVALASCACFARAQSFPRVVHVFVALADNKNQGIVPVPPALGNGADPARNLYWGAAFGVKSFFKSSADWELVSCGSGNVPAILERCVFKYRSADAYLVADAYAGSQIRSMLTGFLEAAAGAAPSEHKIQAQRGEIILRTGGTADLVVYVGHDALMDFELPRQSLTSHNSSKKIIILACASKQYFSPHVRNAGAEPLLWTTGLMAPEAYTLKAALDGWIAGESPQAIRVRAARAYDKYQKCGEKAALRLFVTGW